MSSGQRLLVELRRARNTSIVRRLLKGKSAREISLADWGTFCKRKSSQQSAGQHHPGKPSGGRFSGNRNNRFRPVQRKKPAAPMNVVVRPLLFCFIFVNYKEGERERRFAVSLTGMGGLQQNNLPPGGCSGLCESAVCQGAFLLQKPPLVRAASSSHNSPAKALDDKGFRPLRRATKGFAFGNHKLLKKLDQNF